MRDPTCTRCDLHVGVATVCVGGRGPLGSRLLLVGEAPGENEDMLGIPFVGRAGDLLNSYLKRFELDPRIENAVNCRPPANRKPNKEEIKACNVFLRMTVASMNRLEVVVPLGNYGLWACGLDHTKILSKAGIPLVDGMLMSRSVTFVPLAHPAYLLRVPAYADTWASHWTTVKRLLDKNQPQLPDGVSVGPWPTELEKA